MVDMAASPGNIEISQTIAGLSAGQAFAIQFEAGAPFASTASLQILWNGVVVATIDPAGPMTSYNYVVTANGGNNELTFREVGLGNAVLPAPNANEGYHGTYLANVALVATAVVDEDGLTGPLSFGNHDAAMGDNVVPNTDGDNNEATATGVLGIQWGSDDVNGGIDGTDASTGFVQDGSGRAVYFTNGNVSVSGALDSAADADLLPNLTSQGVAVVTSLTNNGTKLIGMAGDRLVFEVTLSDDNSGAFRFVLHDQLDHAPGGNENDITLTFNYTARDADGDTATGSFIVAVDDDVRSRPAVKSSIPPFWQPSRKTAWPAQAAMPVTNRPATRKPATPTATTRRRASPALR